MFQKTKTKLALSYAALFLFILAALGSAVYYFIERSLLTKVDEALTNESHSAGRAVFYGTSAVPVDTVSKLKSAGIPDDVILKPLMAQITTPVNPVVLDPRIFMIYRSESGMMLSSLPGDLKLGQDVLDNLIEETNGQPISTVELAGHSYRVSASTNPNSAKGGFSDVYAVMSVESEMSMLHNLLLILAVVGGVGCILVVLAGYYMAERALIPIRSAWERQQQFVADASHELRTPLAVMGTHAELLLRHPDRTIEQESHIIAPILKEIRRLSKLVTQLLTLARSDSNQLELQKSTLLLNEQLAESARSFEPLCEMKSIRLETELEIPVVFSGDEARLRQLCVILLDNAVQHTPIGGRIQVSCMRYGSSVRCQVADTGRGIAAKDLPHIFERFYRSDEARNRSEGGTGLGLTIAKWISEKHGGTIQAASTLGQGTVMTVTLPLR
ncbi:sensor histidine kinase [Paenibacillus koleovorans]|uniref:sensor histidine kinase n=1 Tax=Paenibacillus koleovorans TaxID=121608 RepID=UPI000FD9F00F|nr:HAMP domain-containing sensor histidine kinase [Paenibacillus koleovorans]